MDLYNINRVIKNDDNGIVIEEENSHQEHRLLCEEL